MTRPTAPAGTTTFIGAMLVSLVAHAGTPDCRDLAAAIEQARIAYTLSGECYCGVPDYQHDSNKLSQAQCDLARQQSGFAAAFSRAIKDGIVKP